MEREELMISLKNQTNQDLRTEAISRVGNAHPTPSIVDQILFCVSHV